MYRKILESFVSLDPEVFHNVAMRLGYTGLACYRIDGTRMINLIGTNHPWESTIPLHMDNYTVNGKNFPPLGWHKSFLGKGEKQGWNKRTLFYFPEQSGWIRKIVFVVALDDKKRREMGGLDGALEAIGQRICQWVSDSEMRHFISDITVDKQMQKFGADTQTLIDHELRTPLASIVGFAHLLTEDQDAHTLRLSAEAIQSQAEQAMRAVEKLSLTVNAGQGQALEEEAEVSSTNLFDLMQSVCDSLRTAWVDGGDLGPKGELRLTAPKDVAQSVARVNPGLMRRAFWEVLSNAALHSDGGLVEVGVYESGEDLIVDIRDNGAGIPDGCEDLVFLQFYKMNINPKIKRGHRGLGLGLFLARYIAEQHFGRLLLVGTAKRGSLFRFIIPKSTQENGKTTHVEEAS